MFSAMLTARGRQLRNVCPSRPDLWPEWAWPVVIYPQCPLCKTPLPPPTHLPLPCSPASPSFERWFPESLGPVSVVMGDSSKVCRSFLLVLVGLTAAFIHTGNALAAGRHHKGSLTTGGSSEAVAGLFTPTRPPVLRAFTSVCSLLLLLSRIHSEVMSCCRSSL